MESYDKYIDEILIIKAISSITKTELGVVTNKMPSMSSVKDPSKRLGQIVRSVDTTWCMKYFNASIPVPILYSKVLNIDMTSSLSRNTGVDNHDRS